MGTKKRAPKEISTVTIEGEEFDKDALVEECEGAFERLLEERLKPGGSFADYEKGLLEIAHDVVRRKLEKKLQAIADGIAERVLIDHSNDWHGWREGTMFGYRRHALGTVTYHSLVGGLRVSRYTYRERHRNGATYVPLELTAGLMERMTPALAKSIAIGYAYMPSRQCEEFMVSAGLSPPSRSTIDRAARDLGAYAVASQEEIAPLIRAQENIDPTASALSLGLDRTAVPMRHGEDHAGHDGSSDLRRSRPPSRKQAEIRGSVEWRMDYVGTVSLTDKVGRRLVTRKYRLPGKDNPANIVDQMMADVHAALVQRPHLTITVVQDGAPELWRLMSSALSELPIVSTWTEVLDWYHLDERLSDCLDLCTTPKTRSAQRRRWHANLLNVDNGIKKVLRSLRCSIRKLDEDAAKKLRGHINYFTRHRSRTQYADYRRCGTPIGSGITEGACKSVVAARAKRSGQRWSQRGLSAALHLRAIHQSDRFDNFWSFFRRRYVAKHITPIGTH